MTDTQALVERLYVQFSEDDQHIRKWSREPFDGAIVFSFGEAQPGPGMWVPGEQLIEAREALERMAAEVEIMRAHVSTLITLAIDGGLTHDLVAQLYPEAKKSNGQPACDFAKRAQRAINEARQALSDRGRG